ncbi:Retrovirus-related Pol polyprotein from transposon TNT 1-94 [Mycena venus]|uniref:Retrovirus-related Pol polyprotein from transposon TNT 1-94 n=1 Tax=Mycena venus TaxID=2733690 RepID=A0A8H6YVL1_9AGAR|nr:Retrovirus-related Pol polyprotein from transposon TNT 1-94 [Mycena venus]
MTEAKGMTKLTNENYEIWRILMEAVFVRKNVRDVAVGTIPRPSTGPNSKAVRDWDRQNAEARAEMILAVEVDQLAHMTAGTAHEIWEELEHVHRSRGFATKMALRRKFMSMRMDDNQKMACWIGDVRSIAFRLKQAGIAVDDEDIILVLTMGLPDTYDTFVVALDSTNAAALTLDYVIGRLLNEESRKSPTGSREGAFRASVQHTRPRRPVTEVTCFNCEKKGHYQSNCPDKKEGAGVAAADFDAAW